MKDWFSVQRVQKLLAEEQVGLENVKRWEYEMQEWGGGYWRKQMSQKGLQRDWQEMHRTET